MLSLYFTFNVWIEYVFQADKQELEISLANSNSDSSSSELVTSIAEICKEKDALKQEIEVMKQRYVH